MSLNYTKNHNEYKTFLRFPAKKNVNNRKHKHR